MKIRGLTIVWTACALLAPMAVHAQQQPPAVTAGFNVETLAAELAQLLPGDVGIPGAGARAGARAGGGGQQARTASGGQGAAAALRVEKDPQLALTPEQVGKLIPVFEGLKANPMPSPAAARKIQASVDSILTGAQKEGIEQYRRTRGEMQKQFQARLQQAGGGQGSAAGGQNGTASGGAPGPARPQLTPLERRARIVDAFLAALRETGGEGK